MKKNSEILEQVQSWLETVIIGFNLCPFAKEPYENGRVRLIIYNSKDLVNGFESFQKEIQYLKAHPEIDTTLVIYPEFTNIKNFHKLLQHCEQWIVMAKLYYEFQMVFFHPNALVAEPPEDPKNFVIKAPYPILHLLRLPQVFELGKKMKKDTHITNDKKLSSLTPEEIDKIQRFFM